MQYTKKRIAVLVARNSFIHRGVGSYSKSILDWALTNGHTVDVISDDSPRNNGLFDAYRDRVNWYAPQEVYSDRVYKELTAFKFGYNLSASLNFRNALVSALKSHSYDLFVPNSSEALLALLSIGLHSVSTVLYPTHGSVEAGIEQSQKLFASGITDVFVGLNSVPNVLMACQSQRVLTHATALYTNKITECIKLTPMVPELSLLDFDQLPKQKWGVGFIGPWEGDKNPQEYMRALKQSGLPGVVICPSDVSEKKFKQAFEENGIEYKIHVGVTGPAKTDILRSLAAAYHPSLTETYGLGVLETAHTCATVLLDSNDWSHAHAAYCHIVPAEEVAKTLQIVYAAAVTAETQTALRAQHLESVNTLNQLLERQASTSKHKSNLTEQVESKQIVRHADLVADMKSFCSDEIYKFARVRNHDHIEVLHTKTDTYYRIKGSGLEPQNDAADIDNLFD